MKVKLLKKCRNGTRIVKFMSEYALQRFLFEDMEWHTIYTGTLEKMLERRHKFMVEYLRSNTRLFDPIVVC